MNSPVYKLTKAGMPAPDTIIDRIKHWDEAQVRVWLHNPDNRRLLPKAVLIRLLEEVTAERDAVQANTTKPDPRGSKASVRAGGSEGNTAELKQELEKIKSILEKTQINLLEMTEKRDSWRAQSDRWEKNYKLAREEVERLQRLRASHRDQEFARHTFGGGTITVDKNFYRRARSAFTPITGAAPAESNL